MFSFSFLPEPGDRENQFRPYYKISIVNIELVYLKVQWKYKSNYLKADLHLMVHSKRPYDLYSSLRYVTPFVHITMDQLFPSSIPSSKTVFYIFKRYKSSWKRDWEWMYTVKQIYNTTFNNSNHFRQFCRFFFKN